MPQYDCHYCHEREVAVIHNGYGACRQCKKADVDHSKCDDKCTIKKELAK